MFKHLLRELEDLSRTKGVSIPVAADARAYIDKECPGEECKYQFKVMEDDWGALFRDEAVFCPMCGHEAPANHWWTAEQVELGRDRALEYVKARFDSALRRSAAEFNRSHPFGRIPQGVDARVGRAASSGRPSLAGCRCARTESRVREVQCALCRGGGRLLLVLLHV